MITFEALVYFVLILFVVMSFACIAFASMYEYLNRVRSAYVSQQPDHDIAVTVIIYLNSSFKQTARCIQSIHESSWQNTDIILVDNMSGYLNATYVRKLNGEFGKQIKVYRKRTKSSVDACIRNAYKRSGMGQVALIVDSIDVLGTETIGLVARQFATVSNLNVIRLNQVTSNGINEGLTGVLAAISDVVRRVVGKPSIFIRNSDSQLTIGSAVRVTALYRHADFGRPLMMSSATRITEPNPLYGHRIGMQGAYQIIVGILISMFALLLIIKAIEFGNGEILLVWWGATALIILTAILTDNTLGLNKKIDASIFLGLLPIIGIILLFITRLPNRDTLIDRA